MRRHGEIHDFVPGAIGRALAVLARNRFVIGSVVAMAVSFFAFMELLSITDLSFAVPVDGRHLRAWRRSSRNTSSKSRLTGCAGRAPRW